MPVQLENNNAIQRIADVGKISQGQDYPRHFSDYIVPVVQINDSLFFSKVQIIKDGAYSGTPGGATVNLITVDSTNQKRRFFLTTLLLSGFKTTSDSKYAVIYGTPRGEAQKRLNAVMFASTSSNNAQVSNIDFNVPLEMEPGSSIFIDTNGTTGTVEVLATAKGFYEEVA